jgi:hypothetical protein
MLKRRRDEYSYMKVPTGGAVPYLIDGWEVEKILKRQIRLKKHKPLDRRSEFPIAASLFALPARWPLASPAIAYACGQARGWRRKKERIAPFESGRN